MSKKMSYEEKMEKLDQNVSVLKNIRKLLMSNEIATIMWISPSELVKMIEYVNDSILARKRSGYTYRTVHNKKTHEKEN
mgnify:CR=1 FL=1